MKISAIEEYGLRCLLRVAPHSCDEPVSAHSIALREGLGTAYTQKIMRALTKGGLVASKRGAHGGYYMVDTPEEVSLGDVMRTLGGFIEVEDLCERHAGDREVCTNVCNCAIRPVWAHISDFVINTMDQIPLSVLSEDEGAVRQYLANLDQPDGVEQPSASAG